MRRGFLALVLLSLLTPQLLPAAGDEREPPSPIGLWRGELRRIASPDEKPLQLVLKVRREGGSLEATLDGPGALLRNVNVENLILVEDVLSFQVPQVGARFAGNVYGDSIRGTWSQAEQSLPLIFFRD